MESVLIHKKVLRVVLDTQQATQQLFLIWLAKDIRTDSEGKDRGHDSISAVVQCISELERWLLGSKFPSMVFSRV